MTQKRWIDGSRHGILIAARMRAIYFASHAGIASRPAISGMWPEDVAPRMQRGQGTGRVTIPNFITIFRFLLVPAVVLSLLSDDVGWALVFFVVAGLSDAADGFIARTFDQRSELGAYLDPMADKLLLVSVFIVLAFMGELPLWLVVAAVSRDALIVAAVLL